jgi:inosine/xanthosine triphosphatase
MEKILVAVGSTRRPKLSAVTEAVGAFASALAPGAEFEIVGFDVDSGVGHTPSTRAELMRGARQRAEALMHHARQKREAWRYFVGLEGGLDVLHEDGGGRRVFLESWAYAADGVRGYYGRSGGVEIPAALAQEVLEDGVELSAAIDRFAGAVGIRDAQGAWGYFTNNLVTRQDASKLAVITAFAPFLNQGAYHELACEKRCDQGS